MFDLDDPTELRVLRDLAKRAGPKAVPPLLESMFARPDAGAAELLARFDLDEATLARLAELPIPSTDADLRLWLALAFARAGRVQPLRALLEDLGAGRIDLPLADQPWSKVHDRLAAVRPLPRDVLDELLAIEGTAGDRLEVAALCRELIGEPEPRGGARFSVDRSRGLGMSRRRWAEEAVRRPRGVEEAAPPERPPAPPVAEESAPERGATARDEPPRHPAAVEEPAGELGETMVAPEVREAAVEPQPDDPSARGPATNGEPVQREPAPRRAWPHLDAPDAVVAGVPFDLEVGLRGDPAPGVVVSGPLALPAGAVTVHAAVMAHGFDIDGPFEFDLDVTDEDPHPRRTLVLTARADEGLASERRIYAIYSVGSASRAVGERSVRVVPAAEDAAEAGGRPGPQADRADPGALLAAPDVSVEADLTVCIGRGNDAAGHTLQWSLTSTAVELPPPPEQEADRVSSIGSRPEEFLDQIVRKGSVTAKPYNLYRWLAGRGRAIGRAMPPFVRAAVAQVVARRAPEPATILIKSAEPHVPWELAVLGELPSEPGAAPFLGARARVGRWLLGQPPPLPDPPRTTAAGRALAVSGVYDGVPGWARLPHAEAEPREVIRRVGSGDPLPPSFETVVECLDGRPPGDVLHFALHGRFEHGAARSGLVLLAAHPRVAGEVVEEFLEPDHVLGGDLEERRPFVFLNACQVGAAEALLGDYGGMAAAFLIIGASAVVAPLWSVNDRAAHAFALDFYDHTLGGERLAPAELLRRRRAAVTEAAARAAKPEDGLLGVLAYQLYAHPRYTLTRAAAAPPQETEDG